MNKQAFVFPLNIVNINTYKYTKINIIFCMNDLNYKAEYVLVT